MKFIKDNKYLFIGLFVFLFVMLLSSVMAALGGAKVPINPQTSIKEITEIVCTYTYSDEGTKKIVKLELKDNELITKTDISEWEGEKYLNHDCAYYQGLVPQFDPIEGISDVVECDSTGGKRVTKFTLAEYKSDIVRLSEEQYINKKGKFNYKSWVAHMTEEYYSCVSR